MRHVSKLNKYIYIYIYICNNLLIFPTEINPFERIGNLLPKHPPKGRAFSSSSCGCVFVGHLMPADGKSRNKQGSAACVLFVATGQVICEDLEKNNI